MMEELVAYLEEIAKKEAYKDDDEYNPGEQGNYDDVFEHGEHDGKILFAREVLQKIKSINKDQVLDVIKKS